MIKKWIAIINAMTIYERKTPSCLGIERMNRIAKGSGTTIADVMTLKKKLEEINMSLAS
jgi:signal recognition particle subunit SRP54